MNIGKSHLGPGERPYLIAELGVNHDGSVDRALELTEQVAKSGADAVKLQYFEADLLMGSAARLAAYQAAAGESDPVEMLRRLELTLPEMERVIDAAHKHGIDAIVTVFSVDLVPDARKLGWDAFKTASPDIVHRPLLEELLNDGRPLVVSTGASTMEEVRRAMRWLYRAHERVAMLQCVSCYPVPRRQEGFDGILALLEEFWGPVGYSDHTAGLVAGFFAVLHGATIIEKHVTYNREARGPDHSASLEPHELAHYRQGLDIAAEKIRENPKQWKIVSQDADPAIWRFRGPPAKEVLPCELDVRRVSRQSLTTVRALPEGHVLRQEDLTFKRPGIGIEPWRAEEAVGRRLVAPVDADLPLMDEHLEPIAVPARPATGAA